MRQSTLFTKTAVSSPKDEPSLNAQLLTRAGFVNRLMAGVYSFLPLGVRVLTKIESIIREEMNRLGAFEVLMPALQPRDIWERTGRWETVDILFKLKGSGDRDLTLGPTHEEVVTPLITAFVQSYRDLPIAVYQIQTKFRNEVRAKSGLLRGREFRMKDMYSFHRSQAELDDFYLNAIGAYQRVFQRCGLGEKTLLTFASGGMFSKYSHEFQTITPYGEDVIYRIPSTNDALNREIIDDETVLRDLVPKNESGTYAELEELKAIEVGNIFKLGSRFSDAFSATYADEKGNPQHIYMGCYGIGPSRIMGTIAECLSDEHGLVWPQSVAPASVHLISLARTDEEQNEAESVYNILQGHGIEVLFDDRINLPSGKRFAERAFGNSLDHR